MNTDRNSLISTLDASIETFAQMRTSDPLSTAAADTLKQARAMIARALQDERRGAVALATFDDAVRVRN